MSRRKVSASSVAESQQSHADRDFDTYVFVRPSLPAVFGERSDYGSGIRKRT